MSFTHQLAQLVISGVTQGSIYALIALGFVTIYNVTGIINFSQGEFAVIGAFVAITLVQETSLFSDQASVALNWPLPLAALAAQGLAELDRLPFTVKVLLENVLRRCDGEQVRPA